MEKKYQYINSVKYTYAGSLQDRKILLVVGRTNFYKSSIILETLISTLHSFGITILWYENKLTSIQKTIDSELGTWDKSSLNQLFKNKHLSRSYLRSAVKFFLLLKHPSRWRYILNKPPKNPSEQARELKQFIRKLGQKDIIILAHSAGSIIASLAEDQPTLKKIICFGYPFKHPDHDEEPYRTEHLRFIKKPILIIQGRDDEYGGENIIARYALSSSITIMFTNDNHDYNNMSSEDYEKVLSCVRFFIEEPR
ncbi:MAG: hypothetical protein KBD83_07615 [Gammaproteobacteria bacterium]|nr:hypothetical protein [Gammaproteobacteria bacterium]